MNQNIQVLPFVLRREKGSVLSELPPKVYTRRIYHHVTLVIGGWWLEDGGGGGGLVF